MDAPTKRCTKCGNEFPATTQYFFKNKGGKYGLRAECKACRNTWLATYRCKNRDKLHEYDKQYRHRNPDRVKQNRIKYRQSHIEQRRRQEREYHRKHAARYKIYDAEYRKTSVGREKVRIAAQRRRARQKQADGTHTYEQELEQYKRQKGHCYYCHVKLGDDWHPDHVIPLARGGSNDISNIVIACPHCNQRKWAKLPHEWPEGGRLL